MLSPKPLGPGSLVLLLTCMSRTQRPELHLLCEVGRSPWFQGTLAKSEPRATAVLGRHET